MPVARAVLPESVGEALFIPLESEGLEGSGITGQVQAWQARALRGVTGWPRDGLAEGRWVGSTSWPHTCIWCSSTGTRPRGGPANVGTGRPSPLSGCTVFWESIQVAQQVWSWARVCPGL